MKVSEILSLLQEKYPDQGLVIDEKLNDNCIVLPLELVPEAFQLLQADPATDMDYFDFCTCVDRPPEHLHLVYSLHSMTHQHRVQLKVVIDRNNPCVPTVSHLWRNADWNEREVFDLFGVFFPGHSDLRRLMMPEDWEGHPLRKDYAHPNLVKRPD